MTRRPLARVTATRAGEPTSATNADDRVVWLGPSRRARARAAGAFVQARRSVAALSTSPQLILPAPMSCAAHQASADSSSVQGRPSPSWNFGRSPSSFSSSAAAAAVAGSSALRPRFMSRYNRCSAKDERWQQETKLSPMPHNLAEDSSQASPMPTLFLISKLCRLTCTPHFAKADNFGFRMEHSTARAQLRLRSNALRQPGPCPARAFLRQARLLGHGRSAKGWVRVEVAVQSMSPGTVHTASHVFDCLSQRRPRHFF